MRGGHSCYEGGTAVMRRDIELMGGSLQSPPTRENPGILTDLFPYISLTRTFSHSGKGEVSKHWKFEA